jgi:antitoxin YefM
MPWETTYTKARANLASICQEVIDSRDFVLINRPGEEPVALIAASELESLLETAHLLRSPKNAERLMTALNRARRHDV